MFLLSLVVLEVLPRLVFSWEISILQVRVSVLCGVTVQVNLCGFLVSVRACVCACMRGCACVHVRTCVCVCMCIIYPL